jgi:DNA-binding transcriptional regulator YiaG
MDMNEFLILVKASGLSQGKAAEILGVQYDSVKKWCTGQGQCPDGVLVDLLPYAQKNLEETKNNLDVITKRLSSVKKG